MAKEIVLGNKNFNLSYDSNLNIRDFYFPHVGDENHLEEDKNRIGFWVSGKFSWIDEEWAKEIDYLEDAMVSDINAKSDYLNIKIKENATVHYSKNVYVKEIEVENCGKDEKDVKIFFYHVFKLYGKSKNNSAFYDPKTNSIIHYKKNRYILIGGSSEDRDEIYEYSMGNIEAGSEGNYKDAEDGKLEMSLIAHGKIYSMLSLIGKIKPGEKKKFYYHICVGNSFESVRELSAFVKNNRVEKIISENIVFWQSWLNKRTLNFGSYEKELSGNYIRSLLILKNHISSGGGVITSVDYEHVQFKKDTYNYVSPRNNSLAAMAFDEAGYTEVTRGIFRFLKKVVSEEGFFWNRYYPEGAIASTWHAWFLEGKEVLPIQIDQISWVLISISKHYKISKDIEFIEEIYEGLIKKNVHFLLNNIDIKTSLITPCYDIWEKEIGLFFYTNASVYEALILIKEFVRIFDEHHFYLELEAKIEKLKSGILNYFYDNKKNSFCRKVTIIDGDIERDFTPDGSLFYLTFFENLIQCHNSILKSVGENIAKLEVKTKVGGYARFENDMYHRLTRDKENIPGNPWIGSTILAGIYKLNIDDKIGAKEILAHVMKSAKKSGILSEQLHPFTGEEISVAPYIPSHALFILFANRLLKSEGINLIL